MLNIVQMRVTLTELIELPNNPNEMTEGEFTLLKESIADTGGTESQPILGWRMHDDVTKQSLPTIMVLDGNHRRRACIELGIEVQTINLILDYLTEEQRWSIALSRNNLHGTDDLAKLIEAFERIHNPKLKARTGLTSKKLGLYSGTPKLGSRPPGLRFNVVSLVFLPNEEAEALAAFDAASERVKANTKLIARFADYDAIMDALGKAHKKRGVINAAASLMYIIHVFLRHLDDDAEDQT